MLLIHVAAHTFLSLLDYRDEYGCTARAHPAPVSLTLNKSEGDTVLREPALTVFGEEVDDCVGLTVAVEISELRAAVYRHVVDAETPLAAAAGVQHGALRGNKRDMHFFYKGAGLVSAVSYYLV